MHMTITLGGVVALERMGCDCAQRRVRRLEEVSPFVQRPSRSVQVCVARIGKVEVRIAAHRPSRRSRLTLNTDHLMFASSTLRSVLLSIIVAATASAQSATPSDATSTLSELARRSAVSISAVQSRPQGAFARRVGLGYGANGAYLFRLDDAGVLSLRADVGVMSYGGESRRSMLSDMVSDRVQVEVETSNYIVPILFGVQLARQNGAVRPYVNVGGGWQGFFTESSVRGTSNAFDFASTTNHSAWAPAWVVGGGLAMPVYSGKTSVKLDLGAQYVAGGRAQYLTTGSIVDLPGGAIRVTPVESATHLVVVSVGARITR